MQSEICTGIQARLTGIVNQEWQMFVGYKKDRVKVNHTFPFSVRLKESKQQIKSYTAWDTRLSGGYKQISGTLAIGCVGLLYIYSQTMALAQPNSPPPLYTLFLNFSLQALI